MNPFLYCGMWSGVLSLMLLTAYRPYIFAPATVLAVVGASLATYRQIKLDGQLKNSRDIVAEAKFELKRAEKNIKVARALLDASRAERELRKRNKPKTPEGR